ncbi:MAG: energy-coupling factor transporter transmembrane protein EcfT [Clostridia bacterium]|nr:energy-coupling factor transporter transmembrane protein EcfT [Clostridia bacterium]
MLKDITLGQYFPGDSILHRTDARIKILMLIVYLVFVLCAKTAFAFGFVVIATGLLVIISEIPLKTVLKSLKPLLFVLLFTAVINLFFANGEDILWQWKFIKIYREGIENAVKMVIRLTSLVTGTSVLLTYTTSPLDLTDGIERLLVPLKKIGVPVHDFAMMMSIALRFIPTLIEETDKIISAQKARGADFESGNIFARAKALIPILVPLFVSAYRRAFELAEAMECRCYRSGVGKTRMKVIKTRPADYIFLGMSIIACAGIFFLNQVVIPL